MTIGNQLREARIQLGLSHEQLARATKIQPAKILALEEDAFDQLPTGIYLDGIVAAYAREVGCDGAALIRRLRAQVAPPVPATLEEIVAVRPSPERSPWEFSLSLAHGMSAFAGVVVVLAIAGVGVHLYPPQPRAEPRRTAAAVRREVTPPVLAEPPLIAESAPLAERPQPLEDDLPAVASSEPAPVVPDSSLRAPVVPDSSLEGTWTLATEIESSSLRMYEGLRLEYRVELRQTGGQVEGIGRKIRENGVSLRGKRQTSIAVQGTIDGGHLKLTFGEHGARRSSRGTFDLVVKDAGVLRGSFASEAARSAGVVEARRL